MNFKMPNESKEAAIHECWIETFPNRKDWIEKENPTISDIFKSMKGRPTLTVNWYVPCFQRCFTAKILVLNQPTKLFFVRLHRFYLILKNAFRAKARIS